MNDGGDYGGGFYWAGGGTQTNDQTQGTLGMVFPISVELLRHAARVRQRAPARSPRSSAVRAFSLYVRETSGPGFSRAERTVADDRVDQGDMAVRRVGATRHLDCVRCRRALNGQLIDTTTSAQDVSTWHQCAAPAISQSVDTSRYGQGAFAADAERIGCGGRSGESQQDGLHR